jgi:arabinogalactan endo-1,4-beta-galactosidase
MNECKLDYDVFACSYYSYWHGSLDNLRKSLNDIGNKYNKYVMVVETAYPYTDEDGDTFGNSVSSGSSGCEFRYDFSVEGQAKAVTDVFQAVANCNGHGIGAFYWEPAWLGVPDIPWEQQKQLWDRYGSGWATVYAKDYDRDVTASGGSSFDNQALFDFHGKPMESLDVFLNIYPQKKQPVVTTTTTTTTAPPVTKEIILGDINEDSIIDVFDVVAMRKALLRDEKSLQYDINGDNTVGIADLVKLQRFILGSQDSDLKKKSIIING